MFYAQCNKAEEEPESFYFPGRRHSKRQTGTGIAEKERASALSRVFSGQKGQHKLAARDRRERMQTPSMDPGSCQKPGCQVSEFYGLSVKTTIYSTCFSEMVPELQRADCDKVNLCLLKHRKTFECLMKAGSGPGTACVSAGVRFHWLLHSRANFPWACMKIACVGKHTPPR